MSRRATVVLGCFTVFLIFLFPALLQAGQQSATSGTVTAPKEEVLAEKDAASPVEDKYDVASLDGRLVAWAAKRGDRWVLMVNNQSQGAEYDEIGERAFSPDSRRLAYAARRGKVWTVVLEGKEYGPEWKAIESLVFSPDSKRLAYAAYDGSNWYGVLDGQKQVGFYPIRLEKGETRLGNLKFSPDSQRFAYSGWESNGVEVFRVPVIDGKTRSSVPLGAFTVPVFSPDSSRCVFARSGKPGQLVIVSADGKVEGQSPFEEYGKPAFSPDGQHLAFAAKIAKKQWTVMVDGQAGPTFEDVVLGPVYSSDGKHMAYLAWDNKSFVEVIDGQRVRDYPGKRGLNFAHQLTFSPDNRRLSYVLALGGAWFSVGGTSRHRARVISDGQPGKEYNSFGILRLAFSPDSGHLAYFVNDLGQKKSAVVLDNQEGKLYDMILEAALGFSDDNRLSYVARDGQRFVRVTHASP